MLRLGHRIGMASNVAETARANEAWARRVTYVAMGLAVLAVAAHALLIAGGNWLADEYVNFGNLRLFGYRYFLLRVTGFTTRPASELLLYLYAVVTDWAREPLVMPFLLLCWAGMIIAVLWAAGRGPLRVLLGLSLIAGFLLGQGISEMYYWPMSAGAYVPALAAVAVAALLIADGRTATPRGRVACVTALCLAGCSVEAGLFAMLGSMAVLYVTERRSGSGSVARSGSGSGADRAVFSRGSYGVPAVIAAFVLICAIRSMLLRPNVAATDQTFHHPIASLLAALHTLPREMLMAGGAGLIGKVLLGVGFISVFSDGTWRLPPARHLWAIGTGVFMAALLTIVASYYQYGLWGFDRQRAIVQGMVLLLVLISARLITLRWRMPPVAARIIAPACLGIFLLIGLVGRASSLWHDYGLLPRNWIDWQITWKSGMHGGEPGMCYVLPAAGKAVHFLTFQPGHYEREAGASNPWYVTGILNYFGKDRIDIVGSGRSCP